MWCCFEKLCWFTQANNPLRNAHHCQCLTWLRLKECKVVFAPHILVPFFWLYPFTGSLGGGRPLLCSGHPVLSAGQLSLGYDLWAARVFQILQNTENQDWNMPSSAVRSWEMVELLVNTENCCNHLEIHSVPAGDSAWTLTKPERCQGVLIAQGLQSALFCLLIAFNN